MLTTVRARGLGSLVPGTFPSRRFLRFAGITGVLLLGLAGSASAQTPTSYQGNYYNVGAAQPLQQTDNFPATAAQCNQAPLTGTPSTVNPTRFVWDDIVNIGKVCIYVVPATGTLPSLPFGNYEATLTAINAVGRAESARAPFSRVGPPVAPTGFRIIP